MAFCRVDHKIKRARKPTCEKFEYLPVKSIEYKLKGAKAMY